MSSLLDNSLKKDKDIDDTEDPWNPKGDIFSPTEEAPEDLEDIDDTEDPWNPKGDIFSPTEEAPEDPWNPETKALAPYMLEGEEFLRPKTYPTENYEESIEEEAPEEEAERAYRSPRGFVDNVRSPLYFRENEEGILPYTVDEARTRNVGTLLNESYPAVALKWANLTEEQIQEGEEERREDWIFLTAPQLGVYKNRLDILDDISEDRELTPPELHEHNDLIDLYGDLYKDQIKNHEQWQEEQDEIGFWNSFANLYEGIKQDPGAFAAEVVTGMGADPELVIGAMFTAPKVAHKISKVGKTIEGKLPKKIAHASNLIAQTMMYGGGAYSLALSDAVLRQSSEKGWKNVDWIEAHDTAELAAVTTGVLSGVGVTTKSKLDSLKTDQTNIMEGVESFLGSGQKKEEWEAKQQREGMDSNVIQTIVRISQSPRVAQLHGDLRNADNQLKLISKKERMKLLKERRRANERRKGSKISREWQEKWYALHTRINAEIDASMDQRSRIKADYLVEVLEELQKTRNVTDKTIGWIAENFTRPVAGALVVAPAAYLAEEFWTDDDTLFTEIAIPFGAAFGHLQKKINYSTIIPDDLKPTIINGIQKRGWKEWKNNWTRTWKVRTSTGMSTKLDALGGPLETYSRIMFHHMDENVPSVETNAIRARNNFALLINDSLNVSEKVGDQLVTRKATDAEELSAIRIIRGIDKAEEATPQVRAIANQIQTVLDTHKEYTTSVGFKLGKEEENFFPRFYKIDVTKDSAGNPKPAYVHTLTTIFKGQPKLDKKTGRALRDKNNKVIYPSLQEATKLANSFISGQNTLAKLRQRSLVKSTVEDAGYVSWKLNPLPILEHIELERKLRGVYRTNDGKFVPVEQALEPFLENNVNVVLGRLTEDTTRSVEFAREFGSEGQLLSNIRKRTRERWNSQRPEGSKATKGREDYSDSGYYEAEELMFLRNSIDAYFGRYGSESKVYLPTAAALLTTIANLNMLEKVGLTNLGDLIQPLQNNPSMMANLKAARQTALRAKNDKSLASELAITEQNAIRKELQETFGVSEADSKLLMKTNEYFFFITGLGGVNSLTRRFAFNSGVNNAFDNSRKILNLGTSKKDNKTKVRLIQNLQALGVTDDEMKYLSNFNSLGSARENRQANAILVRAGDNAADRDSKIPLVGNRLFFAQSRNPYVKLMGQYSSWAMAKSQQVNKLLERIEGKQGEVPPNVRQAIRMSLALTIFGGLSIVRDYINHGEISETNKELGGVLSKAVTLSGNQGWLPGLVMSQTVGPGSRNPYAWFPAFNLMVDATRFVPEVIEDVGGGEGRWEDPLDGILPAPVIRHWSGIDEWIGIDPTPSYKGREYQQDFYKRDPYSRNYSTGGAVKDNSLSDQLISLGLKGGKYIDETLDRAKTLVTPSAWVEALTTFPEVDLESEELPQYDMENIMSSLPIAGITKPAHMMLLKMKKNPSITIGNRIEALKKLSEAERKAERDELLEILKDIKVDYPDMAKTYQATIAKAMKVKAPKKTSKEIAEELKKKPKVKPTKPKTPTSEQTNIAHVPNMSQKVFEKQLAKFEAKVDNIIEHGTRKERNALLWEKVGNRSDTKDFAVDTFHLALKKRAYQEKLAKDRAYRAQKDQRKVKRELREGFKSNDKKATGGLFSEFAGGGIVSQVGSQMVRLLSPPPASQTSSEAPREEITWEGMGKYSPSYNLLRTLQDVYRSKKHDVYDDSKQQSPATEKERQKGEQDAPNVEPIETGRDAIRKAREKLNQQSVGIEGTSAPEAGESGYRESKATSYSTPLDSQMGKLLKTESLPPAPVESSSPFPTGDIEDPEYISPFPTDVPDTSRMNIIKEKGGNWLTYDWDTEGNLKGIKDPFNDIKERYSLTSVLGTPMEDYVASFEPKSLSNVAETGPRIIKGYQSTIDNRFVNEEYYNTTYIPSANWNIWLNKKLIPYIKTDLATEHDPVRKKIKETGRSIINMNDWDTNGSTELDPSELVYQQRKLFGSPTEGIEKKNDPLNRKAIDWEYIADASTNQTPLKIFEDVVEKQNPYIEKPSWFSKVDPDTPIYRTSYLGTNLHIQHVKDEIFSAMQEENSTLPRDLWINAKKLPKMSVADVFDHVAKIDEWKKEHKKKAPLTQTMEADLVYDYPDDGLRWIALNREGQFASESKALSHSVSGYEPEGSKGHVATYGQLGGGYTDIEAGRTKVYSLRDTNNGESLATVETTIEVPNELRREEKQIAVDYWLPVVQEQFGTEPTIQAHTALTRYVDEHITKWEQKFREERPEELITKIHQIKGLSNGPIVSRGIPLVQDLIKSLPNAEFAAGYNPDAGTGDHENAHMIRFTDRYFIHSTTEDSDPINKILDIFYDEFGTDDFIGEDEAQTIYDTFYYDNVKFATYDEIIKAGLDFLTYDQIEQYHKHKDQTKGYADGGIVTNKEMGDHEYVNPLIDEWAKRTNTDIDTTRSTLKEIQDYVKEKETEDENVYQKKSYPLLGRFHPFEPTEDSRGPGTGFYQYETKSGDGSGASKTAITRTINSLKHYNKPIPLWLQKLSKDPDPDFTQLSEQQQDYIFIGDKQQEKGTDALFKRIVGTKDENKKQRLFHEFWKKKHHKGK